MPPNIAGKSRHGQDAWWYVENLIAGIDATPTQKYLLTLVHRHTNRKTGRAWASQETLAAEMSVKVRTIEREFRWAKANRLVDVERVRTGKLPTEQHNYYWLNVENLKAKQGQKLFNPEPKRKAKHPTHTAGVTPDTHGGCVNGTPDAHGGEHPTNAAGTPDAHGGQGFELNAGNEDSGYETSRAPYGARRKTAAPVGLATQPNPLRVSENNFSAGELRIIEDAQQYIESQVKHGRRIPKLSVIQYVKQLDGAFNHERAIEMALAAISKFPDHAFA